MSKHVLKTQKRLPNMQINSSKVVGVCVDLDKKESGTVRARTNQTEPLIILPRQEHKSLKKLHIQYFTVPNLF